MFDYQKGTEKLKKKRFGEIAIKDRLFIIHIDLHHDLFEMFNLVAAILWASPDPSTDLTPFSYPEPNGASASALH